MGSWNSPKLFELNNSNDKIICEHLIKGLENKRIVDATIFEKDNIHYLFFGFKKNSLDVCNLYYSENGRFGKYVEHPSNPILINPSGARMAGSIVKYNKNLYRFGQNNIDSYGNGIDIFEIQIINKQMYKETYFKSVGFSNAKGPHTIDILKDRMVVDYYNKKFSLLSGIRRIRSSLKSNV